MHFVMESATPIFTLLPTVAAHRWLRSARVPTVLGEAAEAAGVPAGSGFRHQPACASLRLPQTNLSLQRATPSAPWQ